MRSDSAITVDGAETLFQCRYLVCCSSPVRKRRMDAPWSSLFHNRSSRSRGVSACTMYEQFRRCLAPIYSIIMMDD